MRKNEVYLCSVTMVPEIPGNKFPPWISTYVIYYGPDQREEIFPNNPRIKELCEGKKVIGNHPQGTLHREVRSMPITIGDVSSESATFSFGPLSKITIEDILKDNAR